MAIKKGDKVKVDYEGKFEDGEVFDSSNHGDHSHPLEFEVGAGMVIPGFDQAVEGMELNEEKEINIKKEEAYGDYREDLKKEFPKSQMPPMQEGQELKEGMTLVLGTPDGRQMPVKIAKIDGDNVIIDLNHPLAGKNLVFKIKIVEINSK